MRNLTICLFVLISLFYHSLVAAESMYVTSTGIAVNKTSANYLLDLYENENVDVHMQIEAAKYDADVSIILKDGVGSWYLGHNWLWSDHRFGIGPTSAKSYLVVDDDGYVGFHSGSGTVPLLVDPYGKIIRASSEGEGAMSAVSEYSGGLSTVLSLRPVSYTQTYKTETVRDENDSLMTHKSVTHVYERIGLLASEASTVDSRLAFRQRRNGKAVRS